MLRENKISSISPKAFAANKLPNFVDLGDNMLEYLGVETFKPLITSGTSIQVDENLFTCSSCLDFKWLLELSKESQNLLLEFKCTNGLSLYNLSFELLGC